MNNPRKSKPLSEETMEETTPKDQSQKSAIQPIFGVSNQAQPGSWWWTVTVRAAALAMGIGILGLILIIAQPLALSILGVTIAASLSPLVNRLERHMPRPLAIVLIYLVLLLGLAGIGLIIIPPLVNQAGEASTALPNLIKQAQQLFQRLGSVVSGSLANMLTSQFSSAGTAIVSLPVRIFSSLFDALVVLFISIYTLIDAPGIEHFITSLFPEGRREHVINVLGEMGGAMGGYVRGAVINGIIIGTLMYLGMLVIGVDFPLVLGLLAGILEMIPIMGPVIASIPMLIIALLQSPTLALIALIYVIVLHQLESNILVPNIMHSQTEISPLFAIIALLVGYTIGGVLGALISIPLVTAIWVLVRDVLAPNVRRSTGAEIREKTGPEELPTEPMD